ncbi:hypothetical protein AAY473_007250, partial [Plecturocebus cupreus]
MEVGPERIHHKDGAFVFTRVSINGVQAFSRLQKENSLVSFVDQISELKLRLQHLPSTVDFNYSYTRSIWGGSCTRDYDWVGVVHKIAGVLMPGLGRPHPGGPAYLSKSLSESRAFNNLGLAGVDRGHQLVGEGRADEAPGPKKAISLLESTNNLTRMLTAASQRAALPSTSLLCHVETEFCHVSQGALKLLTSGGPPTLASPKNRNVFGI